MKKIFKKIVCSIISVWLLSSNTFANSIQVENVTVSGKTFKGVHINSDIIFEVLLAKDSVVEDDNINNILASGGDILASINGGFFSAYYNKGEYLIYPENSAKIYSVIIKDGKIVNGGGSGVNIIAITYDDEILIDRVSVSTEVVFGESDNYLGVWNSNTHFDGTTLYFTENMTLPVTMNENYYVLTIKDNKIINIEEQNGKFETEKGFQYLLVPSDYMQTRIGYGNEPKIGDEINVNYKITPSNKEEQYKWDNIKYAAEGGPIILLNGEDATDTNVKYTEDKMNKNTSLMRSFIGKKEDGSILLGTGNFSFVELLDLKNQGYVDVLTMDGGASSMLMANDTYIRNAGRNLTSVIAFKEKPPIPTYEAVVNNSNILIDGETAEVSGYVIDGNSYFKLRDVAYALKDTNSKFNVFWDNETKTSNILKDTNYVQNGTELLKSDGQNKTAYKNENNINLNYEAINLNSYLIDNVAYFNLRNIGEVLNFEVSWDKESKSIVISTYK